MDSTASPLKPPTAARGFAAMVASNVLLAFGPLFVRIADVGPVSSAFWRLALAIPMLLILLRVARLPMPRLGGGLLAVVLAAGLFFAADLAAWHLGILRTKLANATLFGNIAIFSFAIYGLVIARRVPSRNQAIALSLAAVGAALLLGRSYEMSPANLAGDALCIFAGVCYTVYLIAMDRARGRLQPLPTLLLSTAVGAGPVLAAALLMEPTIWPSHWGPLIMLALGSQVIGQGLLIYAIGHLPPLVIGLGFLIQPVISGAIGWEFYDERLATADLVGALAICIALVLVRQGDARGDETA
jgi:drug/metabolite transporter (DMT)-like permease